MGHAVGARARAGGMAVAFAGGLVILGWIQACSPSSRALGEACLKDEDCLSGICSQLQCAAEPPFLDGATNAPPSDARPGDVAPTYDGLAVDAVAPDTASPADAATFGADAAVDGAPPTDASIPEDAVAPEAPGDDGTNGVSDSVTDAPVGMPPGDDGSDSLQDSNQATD